MAVCPHCGDQEARSGGFCPACGERVPEAPPAVEEIPTLEVLPAGVPVKKVKEALPTAAPTLELVPEPPVAAPIAPAPVVHAPVAEAPRKVKKGWRERREERKAAGKAAPAAAPVRRGKAAKAAKPGQAEAAATAPKAAPASEPHASLDLSARYEFTSVPADDPPLMGVLLEIEAFGKPFARTPSAPVAHVILVLDVSASMDRPEKYPVLKSAVGRMLADLRADGSPEVLLSIVIFSRGADTVLRAVSARQVNQDALFRTIEGHKLCFGDYTEIPLALSIAGRIAHEQTRAERTLPVRVYLLTDGKPQNVEGAAQVAGLLSKVPADIHALAFGADADVAFLQGLFAGKRGGTVKTVRTETIESAFERVAETAVRVVATRCVVEVDLAPGVVGGEAYRYRPGRVRFPEPAFVDGKRFAADLGTVETGRKYSLLFEMRAPEVEEPVTSLGEAVVRIPGFGGPVEARIPLTIARGEAGSLPGDVEGSVRTARDILGALSDSDPQAALRALRLRRKIYAEERRDPGLLAIIDKAIGLLETTGSLEGLSPDDQATLLSHTCTSGSEKEAK